MQSTAQTLYCKLVRMFTNYSFAGKPLCGSSNAVNTISPWLSDTAPAKFFFQVHNITAMVRFERKIIATINFDASH